MGPGSVGSPCKQGAASPSLRSVIGRVAVGLAYKVMAQWLAVVADGALTDGDLRPGVCPTTAKLKAPGGLLSARGVVSTAREGQGQEAISQREHYGGGESTSAATNHAFWYGTEQRFDFLSFFFCFKGYPYEERIPKHVGFRKIQIIAL